MRLLFTLLVCTIAAPLLHATVIVPADFREVVSGSELIAYGRVVEVTPEWVDGRRRIDTLVTVDVISWFKGGNDSRIFFTVPGGEIGRYRQVIVGAPVFRPGDEAFLFLKRGGTALPYVFGLNQGVFRVHADQAGQRRVISPALVASGDAVQRVRRGDRARRPMALDAFGSQIRAAMISAPGAAK